MKSRSWFLGLLFVAIGVVALLGSLDIIDFSWRIALKLWPMVFVFIGILVLPLKEWMKAVLVLVALTASVLLYQYEASRSWKHCLFSCSNRIEKIELAIN